MRIARRSTIEDLLTAPPEEGTSGLSLEDGAMIAVVGGGPAGSFFSYFLLGMAEAVDLRVTVDIYEPRHFTHSGPAGCNHCGGIISESLVQILATEGISLPPSVVQRGIESYVVHMDEGSVRIESPVLEQRIASVFRGNGPRGGGDMPWDSFDGYLLEMAVDRGARLERKLVSGVEWVDGLPQLRHPGEEGSRYDLVALAVGVNSNLSHLVRGSEPGSATRTTRTYICEFQADQRTIQETLGSSMHVFLSDMPRLEFAALIPKGEYVTLVVLGDDIDQPLISEFLASPGVRRCTPEHAIPTVCNCAPLINIRGPRRPYADRLVLVGDCGVTRLYKDGIGAAYRTAKAAAETVVFHGVTAEAFERNYWPACKAIEKDNAIGKFMFGFTRTFKVLGFWRRGVLRMTIREQRKEGSRRMSAVLWNLFTGSASYREILMNTLHPAFVAGMLWNLVLGIRSRGSGHRKTGGVNAQGRAGQIVG
jgi:flavin-dependent dehydrogenase